MKLITKILGLLVLIVIGATAFYFGRSSNQDDLSVKLSKQIYSRGEGVTVTVRNNSLQQVCFSSCFPYYLQKKDGEWQSYGYPECPEEDVNIPCLSAGEKKTLRFALEKEIKTGLHRIAIPINKGGEKGESFEEEKRIYSDPFDVK